MLGNGANHANSIRITAGAGGFSGGLGGFTADIGPIDLTTLGPVSIAGQLYATDGDISVTSCDAGVALPGGAAEIRAHAGVVSLTGTKISAEGDLKVRGSAGVNVTWAPGQIVGDVSATGALLVQAFGGGVTITNQNNGRSLNLTGDASAAIEAATGVAMDTYVGLGSANGPLHITAFGGDVATHVVASSGTDTVTAGSFGGRSRQSIFMRRST